MKLENLPSAFELEICGKKFFPHGIYFIVDKNFFIKLGWNYNKNLDIKLANLPEKKYYYPESMDQKRREEFEIWWNANRHQPFCLKEQV